MAGETRVVIENGHLGADPVRDTDRNGKPYVRLSVATTPRRKNPQTGEWEDGETEWWTVFERDERQMQTYLSELHKGDAVRVEGNLQLSLRADQNGNTVISRLVGWARVSKNLPRAKQQDGLQSAPQAQWGVQSPYQSFGTPQQPAPQFNPPQQQSAPQFTPPQQQVQPPVQAQPADPWAGQQPTAGQEPVF